MIPQYLEFKKCNFEYYFHHIRQNNSSVKKVYTSTVYAKGKIPKGHVICSTSLKNLSDLCIETPEGPAFNNVCTGWINTRTGRFLTNAKIVVTDFTLEVISILDIAIGEEILVDYTLCAEAMSYMGYNSYMIGKQPNNTIKGFNKVKEGK